MSSRNVPKLDRAVLASRGQHFSVTAKRQTEHFRGAVFRLPKQVTRHKIPQDNFSVGPGGGHPVPGRVECHGVHSAVLFRKLPAGYAQWRNRIISDRRATDWTGTRRRRRKKTGHAGEQQDGESREDEYLWEFVVHCSLASI